MTGCWLQLWAAPCRRRLPEPELVFCQPDGSPWHPDYLTKGLRKLCGKASARSVKLHEAVSDVTRTSDPDCSPEASEQSPYSSPGTAFMQLRLCGASTLAEPPKAGGAKVTIEVLDKPGGKLDEQLAACLRIMIEKEGSSHGRRQHPSWSS